MISSENVHILNVTIQRDPGETFNLRTTKANKYIHVRSEFERTK